MKLYILLLTAGIFTTNLYSADILDPRPLLLDAKRTELASAYESIKNNPTLTGPEKNAAMLEMTTRITSSIPYSYSKIRHEISTKGNSLSRDFICKTK